MPTPDKKYWIGRFTQMEQAQHKAAVEVADEIERQFKTAQHEVERQLSTWYQRYAVNNQVSMKEARRQLNTKELKEFRWTVNEYIKHGKENGISADWSKQLENASARFHVTRLQAIQLELQNTVEVLYGGQTDALDALMKKTYLDSYYHTAFEIQRGVGVAWDIAAVNQKAIVTIINTPWTVDGRNFSERIWANKQALIGELRTQLTQNLMLGKSPPESVKIIAAKMGVAEHKTARLVFTESAYFQAVSQGNCYKVLDVRKFQFIATLDDRTSDVCREMDGQVFDMRDYQPGVNVPPLHPWCRSCTAPYYEDLAGIGERAARDPETGQTYYIPRETKYEDWKQSFVDDGSKQGLTSVASAPVRTYSSAIASRLGKSHYDAMRDILDNCGSSDMREVWDKYEADVGVADTNERKRAHCDWNASIHVDLVGSAKGSSWDKPYQTVFHESGHAIDMIAGRNAADAASCHPNYLYSATYKNGLFPKTIKDEVDALVSARDKVMKAEFKAHATDFDWLHQHGYITTWNYDYFKKYGSWIGGAPKYSKSMAYKAIEDEIRALTPFAKADLSDIMEGATREKIQVGWGHGNGYWKYGDWTLATEAFAEMVDSTASNSESLGAIQKYLPGSYKVFLDMLNDLK